MIIKVQAHILKTPFGIGIKWLMYMSVKCPTKIRRDTKIRIYIQMVHVHEQKGCLSYFKNKLIDTSSSKHS